ncbi:MAG: aminoglycoside phosphotransferase family protein [candidate division Zixibacteria bacterium]|nr:aminoglycoside phosphotransferase family protein [candidate division Zixibacteria bacterium]
MKSEIYSSPLPSPVSSIPLPPDEVLTGLPLLLDAAKAREALCAAGAEVEEGRIFYLRYKPKTSCIVAYEFARKNSETGEREPVIFYAKGTTTNGYLLSATKAENHRWVDVPFGPSVARWDEACALLFAFPNDAVLDVLRILEEPKKLQRFLYENLSAYPSDQWRLSDKRLNTELIRYKPERRAVFRSETKAIHHQTEEKRNVEVYWRVYGENQGEEVFRRMQVLKKNVSNQGLPVVPTPYSYEPERRILLMEALAGKPLLELLTTEAAASVIERTAAALAGLHRQFDEKLSVWRPRDFLVEASETEKMLGALLPEDAGQITKVRERLENQIPESKLELSFVHGDFYYGQVLIDGEKVGFLDFDRSHTGNSLADVGNFAAHLRLLELENRLPKTGELAQRWAEAYADWAKVEVEMEELKWWTALSLFFLSVSPFRRLDAGWPEKTREILQAVEEILC